MQSPQNHSLIWKLFLLFAVYPLPNPYVVTASGSAHSFWLVWRAVVLVVSCLLIAYTYWQRDTILYYADMVGRINDMFQYVSLVLAGLVVVVENFRKQFYYVEIWKIVARIQKLRQMCQVDQQLNKRFAMKFWVCFAIFTGVEVKVLVQLFTVKDNQWFRMWGANILPLTICNMMCLVHLYFFTLLASYFQYVLQELQDIVTFANYSIFVKLDRYVIPRRLEALKDMYGMLYQVSGKVNAIFIWSQAFNFTRMFLQCTCDLHWFFNYEHDFPLLVSKFISPTVTLLLLLYYANLCGDRARSLAPLLFQLKVTEGEMALRTTIQEFAAQLSHEPISFGGQDLYKINYGLLRMMIAGIITYIIIFIQMTPTIKS